MSWRSPHLHYLGMFLSEKMSSVSLSISFHYKDISYYYYQKLPRLQHIHVYCQADIRNYSIDIIHACDKFPLFLMWNTTALLYLVHQHYHKLS